MARKKKIVYEIDVVDKEGYIAILAQYFNIFHALDMLKAEEEARKGYEKLIRRQKLNGEDIVDKSLVFFDDILSAETENFYKPSVASGKKYPPNKKLSTKKVSEVVKVVSSGLTDEKRLEYKKKAEALKKELFKEYPALNRADMSETVNIYCITQVKLNEIVFEKDIIDNHIAIKNLSATLTQLATYLGIDESAKAKQKAVEDKQSIASLALRFQDTIDQFPEIMDRMRYKEIRILLDKYERQELSEQLFKLDAFAGMSVSDARQFIAERESKYEAA